MVTTTPDKFCLVGHVMLLHLERSSWCFLCYFCFPFVVSLCLFFLFCGFEGFASLVCFCLFLPLGFSRLLFLFVVTSSFAFVLA
ncbi:hypothetical protein PRUPE_6G073000 [Prunus persica]|uniref:Transmembrane protein n=1 Tax=Prunus persica TaxID=3760 RepID=A0A251NLI0_PRUPE|nr:hypothetical protein PRUPE_6G073000 [Prunus persica]